MKIFHAEGQGYADIEVSLTDQHIYVAVDDGDIAQVVLSMSQAEELLNWLAEAFKEVNKRKIET